jgi:hypothetical protein
MADHNYQGHTNTQNGDVSSLVQQVADISGRYKNPIGRDRENRHDHEQRDKHAVFTNVLSKNLL